MQSLAELLFRAELRGDLRLLLIGGRALEAHGYVRGTKDVDFVIAVQDAPAMERLLTTAGYLKEAETPVFSRWRHRSMVAEDVDVMLVNAGTFETLAQATVPLTIGSATLQVPAAAALVALKLHAIRNDPERFAKDAADIVALAKRYPENLNLEELRSLCSRFGTPETWSKLEMLLK